MNLSGRKKRIRRTVAPEAVILLLVLGLADFLGNFHRLSLSVLSDTISAEFCLSPSQLGLLGSAILFSHGLMQVPSGMLGDRLPIRCILCISCGITAAGTFLFAVSQSFALLVAARLLTGVGTALVYVPALAALRKSFGDDAFGLVTGFLTAMGQIGSVCASAPLRLAEQAIGWRAAFFSMGGLSVLLGVVSLLCIKKQAAPAVRPAAKAGAGTRTLSKNSLILALWFFLTGGCRLAFQGLWGGRFFVDVLGKSDAQSSVLLMFISLGCIVGSVIFGRLSDRIGSLRALILGTLLSAVCWLSYLLVGAGTPHWVLSAVAVLLGLAGAGSFTAGFTCVRIFSPTHITGRVTSLCNCAIFLGSTLFTQGIGLYMDAVPALEISGYYQPMLAVFAALTLLAILPVPITFRKRSLTNDD